MGSDATGLLDRDVGRIARAALAINAGTAFDYCWDHGNLLAR
jgi:hypothetical protein